VGGGSLTPLMDSRAYRLALTVQIRLALNRTDLALKEVQAAKKWAQDSLLVNLAESWVGLRIVGSRIAKQRRQTDNGCIGRRQVSAIVLRL